MLVDTLLTFANTACSDVSNAALSSLAILAARGNIQILNAMIESIAGPTTTTAMRIKLMGQTAPIGHKAAVAMAVQCLAQPGRAGEEAKEALRQIVVRGDMQTFEGLLLQMEAGTVKTKELAWAVASFVVHVGDEASISKARRLVSHKLPEVSIVAIRTLESLCERGNGEDQVVPALLMCLQGCAYERVRVEALNALSLCSQRFELSTLKVLVDCVNDTSDLVRRRAALLLTRWTLPQTDFDDGPLLATASATAAAEVTKAGTKDGVLASGTKARAQKAAAEASAAAGATAQMERNQLRQATLTSVTSMLLHHAHCPDDAARCAALSALGLLYCAGSTSCTLEDGSLSSLLMKGLIPTKTGDAEGEGASGGKPQDTPTRAHDDGDIPAGVLIAFKGILLVCDAEDIQQFSAIAALPTPIQRALGELAKLSADLNKHAASEVRTSKPDTRKHLFGSSKTEDHIQMIFSLLLPLLDVGDHAGVSAQNSKEKEAAAAQRWMALLAIKRCAVEALAQDALAQHKKVRDVLDKGADGSGGGSAARRSSNRPTDTPTRPAFADEHALFQVAGGERLKSSLMHAVMKMIQHEDNPTLRSTGMELLLDLSPAKAAFQVAVNGRMLSGSLQDQLIEQIGALALFGTHSRA